MQRLSALQSCQGLNASTLSPSTAPECLTLAVSTGWAVIQRGGRDERIAHLQTMAQSDGLHQLDGPLRKGLGHRQQGGRAVRQHLLHCREFGLVAHALQHFEITHRRQRERAQFIKSARGLRVAAQMLDQHIGIDQNGRVVQISLREPSRL